MKQLVWYEGKYWYCDYYNEYRSRNTLSLISLKDSSAGMNVDRSAFSGEFPFLHLCKNEKQYEAVRYFQEKGIAWPCAISFDKPVMYWQ